MTGVTSFLIIKSRLYQLHRLISQAMSSRSVLSEETAREIDVYKRQAPTFSQVMENGFSLIIRKKVR